MTKYNPYLKSICSILILLGLFLILSCNKNGSNNGKNKHKGVVNDTTTIAFQYYNRVFLPDKNNIFREIAFDQSLKEVQNAESKGHMILSESNTDYLQYEEDLYTDTATGIDYVMTKYIFDSEDRLWIVTVNYYIADSNRTNDLFDLLNKNMSAKYGDFYIDSDGYTVWESSYKREDSTEVVYDLGIRKLIKFQDPGIQIELMRFGKLN